MSAKLSYGPQFTIPAKLVDADEVIHTFHIDWMGGDISFESTFADVMGGIQILCQNVWDYENTLGIATVATFFKSIGRLDIVEQHPEMYEYGWCVDNLSDCGFYWLPFWIDKRKMSRNDYDIETFIYPNSNLLELLDGYGATVPEEYLKQI